MYSKFAVIELMSLGLLFAYFFHLHRNSAHHARRKRFAKPLIISIGQSLSTKINKVEWSNWLEKYSFWKIINIYSSILRAHLLGLSILRGHCSDMEVRKHILLILLGWVFPAMQNFTLINCPSHWLVKTGYIPSITCQKDCEVWAAR